MTALLVSGPSWAQEGSPLVVVVSAEPDAAFVRRLAAELSLFGYRVELRAATTTDPDAEAQVRELGAAAVITVDRGAQTAEIVVSERPGESPLRRERERLDPRRRPDTNAAVLAERFRARLTELGIVPSVATPTVAAPSSTPIAPAPILPAPPVPEPRLWVAGSLGVSSGGIGVTPDAQLELRIFPVPWLSTNAFGRLALSPSTVRAAEGETDVRVLSGGVAIDAYPVRTDLRLKFGLAVLLVNLTFEGEAQAPLEGRTDSVLVPAGLLQAGLGYRLSSRLVLDLGGFVGASAPRVGVRFGGRTVERFGQPMLGATLGVAAGVF